MGVFFFQVMAVVGSDQRDAGFPAKPDQGAVNQRLLGQAVVLHFKEKMVAPEYLVHLQSQRAGAVDVLLQDGRGDLAA